MSDGVGAAIRQATAVDIPDLAGVQLAAALAGFAHIFPDSLPKPTQASLEAEWTASVDAPGRNVLAAVRDGRIVAGVVFGDFPELAPAGWGHLAKLYVLPDCAGQGIGGELHDIAVARLCAAGYTKLWMWVLEANTRARGMYERRGWLARETRRTDFPGSGIYEIGYALES
jgi:ribosomal protein S18 acetylase RimI-like enzyme